MKSSFSFLITLLLSLTLAGSSLAAVEAPQYAVALFPTPLLNTPDFVAVFGGRDGKTLHLDRSGLIREVEFVALPGTVFRICESLNRGGRTIYRVTSEEYPYPTKGGYFIDSRFVHCAGSLPPQRSKVLPDKQKVIENLLAARGSKYVWGGNYRGGISQLLAFYPPAAKSSLPAATLEIWQLRGVDCSGLLYEATGGYTPRNTSSLVEYGSPVHISGLDADRIIRLVKPLDLIAWSGHVMIILDRERVIESRLDPKGKGGGVVVRPLREALVELLTVRVPLDQYQPVAAKGIAGFVIRRWYPDGG